MSASWAANPRQRRTTVVDGTFARSFGRTSRMTRAQVVSGDISDAGDATPLTPTLPERRRLDRCRARMEDTRQKHRPDPSSQGSACGGPENVAKVTMPQLGESVAEGTIGKWLKQPGDHVDKYEPLLEVITDKVNAEVPSPFEGTLKRDPGRGRRDSSEQRRDRGHRNGRRWRGRGCVRRDGRGRDVVRRRHAVRPARTSRTRQRGRRTVRSAGRRRAPRPQAGPATAEPAAAGPAAATPLRAAAPARRLRRPALRPPDHLDRSRGHGGAARPAIPTRG